MPHLTIHGCHFEGFRFTVGPKRGDGAPMVISEWAAQWTAANRKACKWEEVPDTVSGQVHLVPGELTASLIQFTPNEGMDKHAFTLDVSGADTFKVFIPTKEGEDRELRFLVKSASMKAERVLGAFGRTAGRVTGKLKISYSENATVGEGGETTDAQKAAAREIPTED